MPTSRLLDYALAAISILAVNYLSPAQCWALRCLYLMARLVLPQETPWYETCCRGYDVHVLLLWKALLVRSLSMGFAHMLRLINSSREKELHFSALKHRFLGVNFA